MKGYLRKTKEINLVGYAEKKYSIIPQLLTKFRDERFKQQELGNTSMQLALKNLMNGFMVSLEQIFLNLLIIE